MNHVSLLLSGLAMLWLIFILPMTIITVEDAEAIPVFKSKQYAAYSWMNIWQEFLGYSVIIFLMILIGSRKLVKAQR